MKLIMPMLLLLLFSTRALAQEGVCEPFDFRCIGKTVQQCNTLGTQWVDMQNCSTGCSGGRCDPELRVRWELLIGGLAALTVIFALVRVLWKRRKSPKPPEPLKKFISVCPEIYAIWQKQTKLAARP